MWCRAIHWRIQDHKGSTNSSGSHNIGQSWYREDHDPNPQWSYLYWWNHGSHPGESQPTSCIWDYSPRQAFCIILNFHINGGPRLYASVVFQGYYTWSHHKNLHRQRSTDVPTCYLFVSAWVKSTEFSLPQELDYCGGGDIKKHWRSCDGGSIPWPHQHIQWQQFSVPNLWHQGHDKSNGWQCQSRFDTSKRQYNMCHRPIHFSRKDVIRPCCLNNWVSGDI